MKERADGGLRRVRSFILGGIVGASAVAAERRRRRRRKSRRAAGLAAFEDAPCYRALDEASRFDAP